MTKCQRIIAIMKVSTRKMTAMKKMNTSQMPKQINNVTRPFKTFFYITSKTYTFLSYRVSKLATHFQTSPSPLGPMLNYRQNIDNSSLNPELNKILLIDFG